MRHIWRGDSDKLMQICVVCYTPRILWGVEIAAPCRAQYAPEIQDALAAAWDEGVSITHAWWQANGPAMPPNPYRVTA